ncbi:MAG: DUF58 domain-containing protein [Deferrisomatales bacterium]
MPVGERPVFLDRRRVYILPTRRGGVLALSLWFSLLSSVNYESSLGLAFTFWMAALVVVSILHTYRNLVGLGVSAGQPEPVFAGARARFPLRLTHADARVRPQVRVGARDCGAAGPVDVAPGGTAVEVHREAPRRGRLTAGALRVETRFPLGLFRAWAVLEPGPACVVYPRPGPLQPPPGASGRWGADGAGGAGQEDFSGLRPYVPGDPPRRIHWKASARSGDWLAKVFRGGGGEPLWLDWAELPHLDSEERLSQLCRWALEAHRAGEIWGLRLPGAAIGPGRGPGHLDRCLTALADFEGG